MQEYFKSLVDKARLRADKAMQKFPQPNYVLNKVAEESGEVIKAAIHYTEGRETWENVENEIIDNLAMLIRLVEEGDEVIGFRPPYLKQNNDSSFMNHIKNVKDKVKNWPTWKKEIHEHVLSREYTSYEENEREITDYAIVLVPVEQLAWLEEVVNSLSEKELSGNEDSFSDVSEKQAERKNYKLPPLSEQELRAITEQATKSFAESKFITKLRHGLNEPE